MLSCDFVTYNPYCLQNKKKLSLLMLRFYNIFHATKILERQGENGNVQCFVVKDEVRIRSNLGHICTSIFLSPPELMSISSFVPFSVWMTIYRRWKESQVFIGYSFLSATDWFYLTTICLSLLPYSFLLHFFSHFPPWISNSRHFQPLAYIWSVWIHSNALCLFKHSQTSVQRWCSFFYLYRSLRLHLLSSFFRWLKRTNATKNWNAKVILRLALLFGARS